MIGKININVDGNYCVPVSLGTWNYLLPVGDERNASDELFYDYEWTRWTLEVYKV